MSVFRSASLSLILPLLLISCGDVDRVDRSEIDAPDIVTRVDVDVKMVLSGAFRNAGTDAPAVLIVPGSGPTDRDGNSPAGLETDMYRLLADALEDRGVSSLRVDKRGMFSSAGAGDPNGVTVDIYAQDYRDWAATLRAETQADCVYLLGHSEGGTMVTAAAAGDRGGLCGLILVAAPGRNFADVLREQLQANPANAPILPDALAAIDALTQGEAVDVSSFHPALQGLFAPQVQGFLMSFFSIDPASLVTEAELPTLVLQGDRDLQVTTEDAQRLADAGGTLVLLPGINHVLIDAPESRAGNLATYGDPNLPVSAAAVNAIVEFTAD
jgi:pimeloyl-ACP methyl ester carboxylesterase